MNTTGFVDQLKIGNINTLALAEKIEQYVIDIRRDLHMYPEISLQEERTMKVVTDELHKLGINFEIVQNGGIIGIIEGKAPGKSVILRADLDALPMNEEETNLNQKKVVVSQIENAAHTCGHDGHTAMLLGAASILVQNKEMIKGKVILAFEQGEENGAGIQALLTRLVEIGADGIWGIHLKSDLPAGKISVDPGPRMSAAFLFDVIIKGKSGHGSRPDLACSPLDCFTDFYTYLKTMRLTSLDPFQPITYSIGSISSGSVANIIPEDLHFNGTVRYLQYEQGLSAATEFHRLLEKTCELNNCTFEYIQKPKASDLLVYNNETCAPIASNAIKIALGEETLIQYPAWMASEPFAYYQKYFPGIFAFVGIKNEEKGTGAEHHNAHFDLDEDALKLGVAATIQYALDFLNSEEKIEFIAEDKAVAELFS